MSEGLKAVRQWVSVSGGACDARLGHGVILGEAGSLFRVAVGRPRRAALVTATTDEELVELTRRELSSEGCEVAGLTLSDTGEMRRVWPRTLFAPLRLCRRRGVSMRPVTHRCSR